MEVRKNLYLYVESRLTSAIYGGIKSYNINLGIVGYNTNVEFSFSQPFIAISIVHKDTCNPEVFKDPYNTHSHYCDHEGCMDTARPIFKKSWWSTKFYNYLDNASTHLPFDRKS